MSDGRGKFVPSALHAGSQRFLEEVRKNRQRVKELGPGIITGGAGDDPAGIVTYTTVGATTGFSLLWLMLLSTPMMVAVQDMAARLAIVTGKSLPEIIRGFYSKKAAAAVVLILAIANVITIGADLQGVAEVLELLTGVRSVHWLIPITALIAYLVTFKTYRTVKRVFVGLTLVLVAYMLTAVLARPNVLTVLEGTFLPHLSFSSAFLLAALGMLGTTISPYMLFWQASEEKEEHKTVAQARSVQVDTAVGMIYSNLIAFCIIVAAGVMLFGRHMAINTVSDALMALEPLGKRSALALFSVGILSAGFLAIPVLAGSTAYAVADTFGWREGLDHKVSDAKGFYSVFFGALIIGDLIHLSPLTAVQALYYSQVLDGLLLPVLVGVLLALNANKEIVGEFSNSWFNRFFGWLTLLFSSVFAGVLLVQALMALF